MSMERKKKKTEATTTTTSSVSIVVTTTPPTARTATSLQRASTRCPRRGWHQTNPPIFSIVDPVTRNLAASKYLAKAHEDSIKVANAFFFASVTRASLDDVISAALEGDQQSALTLLSQVSSNMVAIEYMPRDRMLFLGLHL